MTPVTDDVDMKLLSLIPDQFTSLTTIDSDAYYHGTPVKTEQV